MPRIQEYLPEQNAQGPVGQTSPVLEQVQDYGKGIQALGKDVGDAATVIRERDTQTETSDAYAAVADKRSEFLERIQNAANTGAINEEDHPDSLENIKADYQSWMEDQADQYNTPGGKNAFVRASARAQGVILQHGTSAATVVAGKQAADQFTNVLNKDSNAVLSDPTLFDTLRDNQRELLQTQVENGVFTAGQASQISKAMDREMSMAVVRGQMSQDFNRIKAAYMQSGGKIDPNAPGLNTAQALLDGGHLDGLIDTDVKQKLKQEIKSNQSAAQSAGVMALAQQVNAQNAAGAKALSNAYEQIRAGNYDPKTGYKLAQQGLISPAEQLQLQKLSEANAEPELPSNPRQFNNLMGRILSPDSDPDHISDPRQLLPFVSKKGDEISELGSFKISPDDFNKLTASFNSVSQNRVNRFNEAQLMQRAQAMIGDKTDDDHFRMMQFTHEVQKAKQDAMDNKQPISKLFDPSSPTYLGNSIAKYNPSPAARLGAQAGDVLSGGGGPRTNIDSKPGAISSAWGAVTGFFHSAPAPVQAASQGAKPSPQPNEVSQMSLDQLKTLDPKTMTPAARQAARARYNQLHSRGGQ